jgi:S1-C subfamily serine protease
VATGATAGAVVSDVEPGSPAGSVIAPGDVITAVAGRRVGTPEDALLAIARLAVNAPAAIELRRNRERLVVTVTPVALEDPALVPLRDVLGVTLRRVATGARADVIEPGGAAAVGGMQEGDVVTWIDGTDAPTPQRVTAIWAALAPKESALVRIDRGGEPLVLALGRP